VRLFVGIDIPADILNTLAQLIERLRPVARINWSPAANLHITTRFIGEWPEPRIGDLDAALRRLTGRAALGIAIRSLGFFPNARSPRVFWAGIEGGKGLAFLAADTDRALAALGLEPEKRAFSPHLTLARIKEPLPLAKLHESIAALPATDFGSFTADRFYLYRSQLRPGGSVYTKMAEYMFV
jgi:2'-5' RNA ligase